MGTQIYTNGVTLTDATEFGRFDSAAYAALTGVAGTNTITATGPASYTYAASRPPIYLVPANTNTGATTINVTPSGGAALGARNIFRNGAACVGGELRQNVPVALIDDGTRFHIIGSGFIDLSAITNSLAGDVALNNTATYFTGPTVAQGTAGTWYASGTVNCVDSAGAANFEVKLWDGTTVMASTRMNATAANAQVSVSISGFISAPAGNIRISVKDSTSVSGSLQFNSTGNSKDCTITAIRVA